MLRIRDVKIIGSSQTKSQITCEVPTIPHCRPEPLQTSCSDAGTELAVKYFNEERVCPALQKCKCKCCQLRLRSLRRQAVRETMYPAVFIKS
ncbi:hypothetical protein AVEN_32759-1 [Araneus ventricosus]|uniref:Uncharacterized protein n=1 Tax=Araneus ventricosus TaxID=182803 RepID=A0A4Y2CWI1_ARAVE|nr:hypothetical protein AVEN_32759-1 [Araneus ventricosus]